ncbi:MAG: flavodoxin domain-containing protein [Candidatus Bathyarchaeota archaeon]|jgi:menaquinone-dependent protoporphyrinogen IX oxidase
MVYKTLVAFASKGGATKEASEIIADALKEKHKFTVDLVNLKKKSPNLEEYDNIVIGSGVRNGKVYDKALKFLKQDFGDRKIAFFVCSGDAGDPNKYEEAYTKYITDVLANYPNIRTVAAEAFGGRMKMLWKTVFNNFDPAKIRAWAEKLGSKLT